MAGDGLFIGEFENERTAALIADRNCTAGVNHNIVPCHVCVYRGRRGDLNGNFSHCTVRYDGCKPDLPAADPRINGTLQAIEDRLLIDNEFVLRYEAENTSDGLPAGEGVFWRAASGLSTTTYCRAATPKPGSSSIVCSHAAMTWDCLLKRLRPLTGTIIIATDEGREMARQVTVAPTARMEKSDHSLLQRLRRQLKFSLQLGFLPRHTPLSRGQQQTARKRRMVLTRAREKCRAGRIRP